MYQCPVDYKSEPVFIWTEIGGNKILTWALHSFDQMNIKSPGSRIKWLEKLIIFFTGVERYWEVIFDKLMDCTGKLRGWYKEIFEFDQNQYFLFWRCQHLLFFIFLISTFSFQKQILWHNILNIFFDIMTALMDGLQFSSICSNYFYIDLNV